MPPTSLPPFTPSFLPPILLLLLLLLLLRQAGTCSAASPGLQLPTVPAWGSGSRLGCGVEGGPGALHSLSQPFSALHSPSQPFTAPVSRLAAGELLPQRQCPPPGQMGHGWDRRCWPLGRPAPAAASPRVKLNGVCHQGVQKTFYFILFFYFFRIFSPFCVACELLTPSPRQSQAQTW